MGGLLRLDNSPWLSGVLSAWSTSGKGTSCVFGHQAQARLDGPADGCLSASGPTAIEGTDKSWLALAPDNIDQVRADVGIHRLCAIHPATIVYILSRSVPSVKSERG